MGQGQDKEAIHAEGMRTASSSLSTQPIPRARQIEELYFGNALDQKAEMDTIVSVTFLFDKDDDVQILFETRQRRYGVAIIVKDKSNLGWKECQAISMVLKIVARGNLMTNSLMADHCAHLETKFGHIECRQDPGTKRMIMIITPGQGVTTTSTDDQIRPISLSFATDEIMLIGGTKADFYFTFGVLMLAKRNENGSVDLGMRDCEALSEILYLCETGDKMTKSKFLMLVDELKDKFNYCTYTVLEVSGKTVYAARVVATWITGGNESNDNSGSSSGGSAKDNEPRGRRPSDVKHDRDKDKDKDRDKDGKEKEGERILSVGGKALRFPGVELKSQIADSGQAVVWKAMYKGKLCAVKIFKSQTHADNYKAELKGLLKSGDHPNVMTIFDFFDAPLPCIVMRLVEGGDLCQYLRRRAIAQCAIDGVCTFAVTKREPCEQAWMVCRTCAPSRDNVGVCTVCASSCHKGHDLVAHSRSDFVCGCGSGSLGGSSDKCKSPGPLRGNILSDTTSIDIMKGIGAGLAHLHQGGFIHRDMKSLNVLMDGERPVIIDMGLAAAGLGSDTLVTKQQQGTALWNAPEMLKENKYSDKTDVYAFGIIMWEILSGALPYMDRQIAGVAALSIQVCEGLRPTLTLCGTRPKWLMELMQRCWHPDPRERPNMVQALKLLTSEGRDGSALLPLDPRRAFREADLDKSGSIAFEEFAVVLKKLGATLTPAEVLSLFESLDTEKKLSLDEEKFTAWYLIYQRNGLEAAVGFVRKPKFNPGATDKNNGSNSNNNNNNNNNNSNNNNNNHDDSKAGNGGTGGHGSGSAHGNGSANPHGVGGGGGGSPFIFRPQLMAASIFSSKITNDFSSTGPANFQLPQQQFRPIQQQTSVPTASTAQPTAFPAQHNAAASMFSSGFRPVGGAGQFSSGGFGAPGGFVPVGGGASGGFVPVGGGGAPGFVPVGGGGGSGAPGGFVPAGAGAGFGGGFGGAGFAGAASMFSSRSGPVTQNPHPPK